MLTAPAGFGKSAFLRQYAGTSRDFVACELTVGRDPARDVLDALVASDPKRAAKSAADRLAQRRESAAASSREALRREWLVPRAQELLVIHDPMDCLATPAGVDLFEELAGTSPPSRTLALTVRAALPPALAKAVPVDRTVTLRSSDLALSAEDVLEYARSIGVPKDITEAVYDRSGGWPLPTRLLLLLARRESAPGLLEAIDVVPHASLLTFAIHRTIAALSDDVRSALGVVIHMNEAAHSDLVRILGDRCDDAVFARLGDLPFVELRGERATVHPSAASVMRERFQPLIDDLYGRTLRVLSGDGAYVGAARIALGAGDVTRAAAIIDAAPPYTAAPVPLGEYERIIDRIDRDLITRFPNLWVATIPYRSFSVDPATYVREAETVYYCLNSSAGTDQRAAVLMLLASAYVNIGRSREAYELIEEALVGFASAPCPARASILNLSAALRGIEGRFRLAHELAQEAAAITRDDFGESQTLLYLDSHEAAYSGRQERVVVIMDELLRRRSREDLPLYLAYAAASAAIFSWVNGDDGAFDRYMTVMEDAITPGLAAGLSPIVEAARGRPVRGGHDNQWPALAAMAQIYEIAAAMTDAEALSAARAAARNADLRGDPYMQLLAHVAIYVLDGGTRDTEAETLLRIVSAMESQVMHLAIDRLLAGAATGLLSNFISRRVLREREPRAALIAVELLSARVTRGGAPIRLTEKEFELLALLASTHGSLSRERIGEALWNHLDPEEWRNNFKVTLHRIRTKLGVHDVVLGDCGRYRIGPAIDIDLRRAEALVREHASSKPLDDATRRDFEKLVSDYRTAGAAQRFERFAWTQSLVARMTDAVCSAGLALSADARLRGAPDDALRFASLVCDIDPFNEDACEITLRVLIARGDTGGARRAFRRYAAALDKELGAAPSAKLVELVRLA